MSKKRWRSEEAAALDSAEHLPQPTPQKRMRWTDRAPPEPRHVCDVSTSMVACLQILLDVCVEEYNLLDNFPAETISACPQSSLVQKFCAHLTKP